VSLIVRPRAPDDRSCRAASLSEEVHDMAGKKKAIKKAVKKAVKKATKKKKK
jgi:hypothetical protein